MKSNFFFHLKNSSLLWIYNVSNSEVETQFGHQPGNCGAVSREVAESELFGYKKGAFTGALKEGKSGLLGSFLSTRYSTIFQ
ncbi:MAG: sigma 54-interacting transcriptional regulator [Deltaproteobacteria bacterium]|nr:sigma 54-interacting transcriptional regulator [Deltaproteobacteria bacterium]